MSSNGQSVSEVLKQYPVDPNGIRVHPLGNHGGFSGAQLWRIEEFASGQSMCLRKWPNGPGQLGQVRQIHALFEHVVQKGFDRKWLPIPRRTQQGHTALVDNEAVYELSAWLPGKADYWESPADEKIRSAALVLARFHHASRDFFPDSRVLGAQLAGIQKRIALIDELNQGFLETIRYTVHSGIPDSHGPGKSLQTLAVQAIGLFEKLNQPLRAQLKGSGLERFDQQVCIKDIWHDHVLFQGHQVSGIVDFGGMGRDNIATDISRLFGSLLGNSGDSWGLALEQYQVLRELSKQERELIVVYDRSTTMLAAMNWLRWIFIENRKFESYLPIIQRMERLVKRLGDWI